MPSSSGSLSCLGGYRRRISPMSRPAALRFTYQDYLLLPEDKRYEIIDGDLFMTPAPSTYHQRISQNLEFFLERYVREHGAGQILHAPCDVVLSETDVVQPDILFVAKDRLGIIEEKYVSAAPNLAIEILSQDSAMRDRTIKAKLYARAGVRELWIVDPAKKTIEILRNTREGFERQALFRASDVLVSPAFAGLETPLTKIF